MSNTITQYGVLYRERGIVSRLPFATMNRGTHDTLDDAKDEAFENQFDGPLSVFSVDIKTGKIDTVIDSVALHKYFEERECSSDEEETDRLDPQREWGTHYRGIGI